MRKRLQLLFILYTSIIGIRAQDGGSSSNMAKTIDMYPKSPEASALSQFVDIPAGNYTGVADFSIPIYTIELEGQKIPIELRYTTTGIKVDQIATRVGLGWVLDAGPSLSQQVFGNLDVVFPRPQFNPASFVPNYAQNQQDPSYQLALRAAGMISTQYDPEPDVFTYRLLNKSGKYILDRTGTKGISMPYNQTDITASGYRTQMDLVDEEGFKYTFNSFVDYQTKIQNSCTTASEFTYDDPNFKLQQVVSPKNELVKYVYASFIANTKYIPSIQTQVATGYYAGGPLPAYGGPYGPTAKIKCINYAESKEAALSEIQFKGGKVQFTYSNRTSEPRSDMPGDVYLKAITVINDKGQMIKSFTLEYEYFFSSDPLPTTSSPGFMYMGNYIAGMNYRLKLKRVIDNLTNSKYVLDYYESANDGKKLPIRTSNDQDFWGVYNGANNGIKAIASTESAYYNGGTQYLGANKNPNIQYGVLGNLKQITYPTGGYTTIEYEADDFGPSDFFYTNELANTGTIRVRKIESFDNNNGKITREYTYKVPTENHILPYVDSSGMIHGDYYFSSRVVRLSPSPVPGATTSAVESYASNNPGWQTSNVNGKSVAYTYVQEYYKDEKQPVNSYRKEYEFTNINDYDNMYSADNGTSVTWSPGNMENGLLKEEILFNSNGQKVKETYKSYKNDGHFNSKYGNDTYSDFDMGYGLKIYPSAMANGYTSTGGPIIMYRFNYYAYSLRNTWIREDSVRVRDYINGTDYIETLQVNNYSIPAYKHTYPTESISTGSGNTMMTTFRYPQEITAAELGTAQSQSVLNSMLTKNLLSTPLIVKSYKNGVVNSEVRTFQEEYNTNVSGTTMILPKYIYVKKGENAAVEDRKITFDSYDTYGNLTQYTLENGIPVSVIWGYNKTMPIAKVEGALLSTIPSSAIDAIVNASNTDNNPPLANAGQTEQNLVDALDTFRKGLSSYQVTTYSYDPLIGVRSVTPPSGQREYYTYDDAGRLQEVKRMEKDGSGNEVLHVLKKNEYHYKD
ncbi:RHS repeat domain-containing protein [Epilithonimonas hungarica]|uniref:YD repeat-containing protein n=1 Tax=Epilithonimonas hungarica TaxID=454006 RepID=A0A1G7FPT4_9FLAO|nr:hypothetical protein [Epilithonimonas hungarica]SDE77933.1 YD repeat-containing protein [Epilithonimonas hungarica]